MHYAGIEFDFALFIGQPAVTDRIIIRIVFDNSYRGNDRVQRVAALLEDVHAAAKRVHPVSAGDDHGPLTLRGGLCAGSPIADTGLKSASRRGGRRTFEQIGYARGSTAGKRGKK